MSHTLGEPFESTILNATGASSLKIDSVIQELWSGYGQILRLHLEGSSRRSVVAKHVQLPLDQAHPRGWNTNLSHDRKVFSYRVETSWYQTWGARCDQACRTPEFLAFDRTANSVLLLLEDLDAADYPVRLESVSDGQMKACLEWLAEFHALFLNESPKGLWPTGTYWHLETRPDELDALTDTPLKAVAVKLDRLLSEARYQTFVHGDAKLANFCFSACGAKVSALDFQYVGGGCGMKDVAYFIGSCLDEEECEAHETALLAWYFECLAAALNRRHPQVDAAAVINEWRDLFPIAWTDFHRFLKGWCPSHWKINSYSERMARSVIERLS